MGRVGPISSGSQINVPAGCRWARDRGHREFASDALLENVESQRAHEALGSVEVERAVRFRKVL